MNQCVSEAANLHQVTHHEHAYPFFEVDLVLSVVIAYLQAAMPPPRDRLPPAPPIDPALPIGTQPVLLVVDLMPMLDLPFERPCERLKALRSIQIGTITQTQLKRQWW